MHTPLRMCVACRQMKPKGELIKVVKTEDGAMLDICGKKSGRGAYVCKDDVCIENARKRRAFARHFKMPVNEKIYEEILEAAKNG